MISSPLDAVDIGVEREERIGVPQRQQHLANRIADRLAVPRHGEIAADKQRRGHHVPAQRIGPVGVEHLDRVGIVLQPLGKLLLVLVENDAVADAAAERRAVEQRRRQHHQRVEPAARLADIFDDEVAGEMALEPVLVLERIVHLANGIEPDSNQQSSTSSTRRIIDLPVGSSGFGRTSSST